MTLLLLLSNLWLAQGSATLDIIELTEQELTEMLNTQAICLLNNQVYYQGQYVHYQDIEGELHYLQCQASVDSADYQWVGVEF